MITVIIPVHVVMVAVVVGVVVEIIVVLGVHVKIIEIPPRLISPKILLLTVVSVKCPFFPFFILIKNNFAAGKTKDLATMTIPTKKLILPET